MSDPVFEAVAVAVGSATPWIDTLTNGRSAGSGAVKDVLAQMRSVYRAIDAAFDGGVGRETRGGDRQASASTGAMVLSMLWLGVMGGIGLFWRLGDLGIIDETEPLFAEASRQMLLRQDWVTPFFNELPRFDKPPLIYWYMATAFRVLGQSEWTVRLPSAISAFGLMVAIFYGLFRYGSADRRSGSAVGVDEPPTPVSNWIAAWIGSACFCLNLLILIWGRTGVSDLLLCGWIGAALISFFLGYAGDRRWYWVFHGSIALAILAKGPVGIVVPGLIIVAFWLYTGQFWTKFWEVKPIRGLLLITAIALPWYLLVIQANGDDFIRSFFGYHNVSRFTGAINNHGAPIYAHVFFILFGFAPWSLYLPAAIGRLRIHRRSRWLTVPRSQQLGLFAATWFIGVFVFFTIAATKLPSYILPSIPAAAILVGLYWSDRLATTGINPTSIQRSDWAVVGFLGLLAAAIFSGYYWLRLVDDPAMPNFPKVMQDSGLLLWGTGICGGTALLLILVQWQQRSQWIWVAQCLGMLLFITCFLLPGYALADGQRQEPLRQIAAAAIVNRGPEEAMIMVGFEKPSLVYYTHRPIAYFRRARSALRYVQAIAPTYKPKTLLVVAYPDRLNQLGLNPDDYVMLHRSGAYGLIRVGVQQLACRLDCR
jgi:4-amino-4-deoxy-L-arabinose transferase-like glycosyltransferase